MFQQVVLLFIIYLRFDFNLKNFLQDVSGVHYSGFKTPHIHNLSDLVQANLAVQVRILFIFVATLLEVMSNLTVCLLPQQLATQSVACFSSMFCQARQFGHLQLSDSSDDSPSILVFQVRSQSIITIFSTADLYIVKYVFLIQISARIPFKADIVFLSGTSTRDSRVEERASRLTGLC